MDSSASRLQPSPNNPLVMGEIIPGLWIGNLHSLRELPRLHSHEDESPTTAARIGTFGALRDRLVARRDLAQSSSGTTRGLEIARSCASRFSITPTGARTASHRSGPVAADHNHPNNNEGLYTTTTTTTTKTTSSSVFGPLRVRSVSIGGRVCGLAHDTTTTIHNIFATSSTHDSARATQHSTQFGFHCGTPCLGTVFQQCPVGTGTMEPPQQ